MRCNICSKEIGDYGNNPYPICSKEDYKSRCCDICNMSVIQARIMKHKYNLHIEDAKVGDLVAIFHSTKVSNPEFYLRDEGKFLSGTVENVEKDEESGNIELKGDWGHFPLTKDDSFAIMRD